MVLMISMLPGTLRLAHGYPLQQRSLLGVEFQVRKSKKSLQNHYGETPCNVTRFMAQILIFWLWSKSQLFSVERIIECAHIFLTQLRIWIVLKASNSFITKQEPIIGCGKETTHCIDRSF